MSSENPEFRVSSFGGFNKDDVTKYIEKLNFKFNEQTEMLNIEIKKLTDDVNILNQIEQILGVSKLELKDEVAKTKELSLNLPEINKKEEENKALKKEIEQLKTENESLTQVIRTKNAALDEETEEILNQNDELIKQNKLLMQKLHDTENAYKKYDVLKDTLVQLEVDAHLRAKNIISNANHQSENIINKANIEAEKIENQMKEQIALINKKRTEAEISMKMHIADKLKEVSSALDDIKILTQNLNQVCANSENEIENFEHQIVDILNFSTDEIFI